MGCYFLFQGIFLTQGLNSCLLHWPVDSFTTESPGKPIIYLSIYIYIYVSWDGKIPWRRDRLPTLVFLGFPGGSDGKEFTCNTDLGSIPGLGRSPGGGHGNPLQYSFIENPHGQKSLAVHGVAKSWTRLSDSTSTHTGI